MSSTDVDVSSCKIRGEQPYMATTCRVFVVCGDEGQRSASARPSPWLCARRLLPLSVPGVDALVLVRSEQMRQLVVTSGTSLNALCPMRLRRAIMYLRRLCPGAPASALFSLVAARSPLCTEFGMPLALQGDEPTRKTARSPSRDTFIEEAPHG
jgi:hypothetical protein